MNILFNKITFIIVTLYIIMISSISSFYVDILSGYNKKLSSIENKIVGVEYLKLLHRLSADVIIQHIHNDNSDNAKRKKSIYKTRKEIYSFLEKLPKFHNTKLDKYLNSLGDFSLNFSDDYNLLEYINHENYMVGNSAEILFSEDKERYFLGTLITHYIPEFFISLGVYHNILEESIEMKYMNEAKESMYVEQGKLIYLSSQEIYNIISLLHEYENSKDLYNTISNIINKLEQLKKDKNNLNSIHQLINLAEELSFQNTELLTQLLKSDELYFQDKILFNKLLLIFIIFLVTVVFIYFSIIYNANVKKDKELKELNDSLVQKVKDEVSKNREKDRHMIEQSRLAQMGEMISMIAHQWRQPLSAISASSAAITLKSRLNKLDKDIAIELSERISKSSQHLSSTIDDFREFFKSNKEKSRATYNELITSALGIIETSIENKNIKLIRNLECNYVFDTYPNEIKQVILNLIKNSEDILIEKEIKNPTIKIKTTKGVLSVSDNGGGIPEDIIDKIFDPYFSTKLEKNGTGLGLYMSKTIIEEHCKGKLVVSNDKFGAVFKIILGSSKVG